MTSGSEFTVKEIVIELRNDVNRLIDKIDRIDRQGSIGTKQELEDHETRIRANEVAISDIVSTTKNNRRISSHKISWSAIGIAAASAVAQIIANVPHGHS